MITYSSVLGTGGAVLQARAVALAVAENPDKQLVHLLNMTMSDCVIVVNAF